jgi:hypothetical protein
MPLLLHDSHFVLHAEHRPEHISIERGGKAVAGLFRHRPELALGACVVHCGVEPTEPRDGPIHQGADISLVADIGANELRLPAEIAQFGGKCLAGVLVTAGYDDARAFLRECDGGRASDTRQGAGDLRRLRFSGQSDKLRADRSKEA